MNRVVVTGLGIISCIGNTKNEIVDSLKNLKSGIIKAPEYKEFGFRSLIHGKPIISLEENIDRKILRFMGDGAAFNYIAMKKAIEDGFRIIGMSLDNVMLYHATRSFVTETHRLVENLGVMEKKQ